jgi:hypothetical protein
VEEGRKVRRGEGSDEKKKKVEMGSLELTAHARSGVIAPL